MHLNGVSTVAYAIAEQKRTSLIATEVSMRVVTGPCHLPRRSNTLRISFDFCTTVSMRVWGATILCGMPLVGKPKLSKSFILSRGRATLEGWWVTDILLIGEIRWKAKMT